MNTGIGIDYDIDERRMGNMGKWRKCYFGLALIAALFLLVSLAPFSLV